MSETVPTAQRTVASRQFKVYGMDCAEEVAILKRRVGPAVGGSDRLSFDVLNGKMFIDRTAAAVPDDAIVDAVRRTGMRADVWQEGAVPGDAASGSQTQDVIDDGEWRVAGHGVRLHAWIAGGVSYAFGSEGMGMARSCRSRSQPGSLYAVSIDLWRLVRRPQGVVRGARHASRHEPADDGGGRWERSSSANGSRRRPSPSCSPCRLALESWSVGRARRAVEALLDLAPPSRGSSRGRYRSGSSPQIRWLWGRYLVVRPGERIPLDGVVRHGASHVNQAPITGESVPVSKEPGASSSLARSTATAFWRSRRPSLRQDTTLAHIIKMVGEAQRKRGPAEQWVERFARIYTPAVLALAILVAVVPPLLLGQVVDRLVLPAPWCCS